VAGWAYSWVAQLGTERSSWTAPIDAVRLAPGERAEAVAIRQVKALAQHLAGGPVPLFVFDAGYSPSLLTAALAEVRAAVLVRFRDDRVFFHSAAPPARGHGGRPRRHGAAVRCALESTWGEPDAAAVEEDPPAGAWTCAAGVGCTAAWCGGLAGSTWSTRCDSAKNGWAGTVRGWAPRSRWIGGPGPCWLPTPNYGSLAASSPIAGCRGSGLDHLTN
jgi:hypothetical protein